MNYKKEVCSCRYEPAFVVTQNTLKSPQPNLLDKIFANLYPTNIFQT